MFYSALSSNDSVAIISGLKNMSFRSS